MKLEQLNLPLKENKNHKVNELAYNLYLVEVVLWGKGEWSYCLNYVGNTNLHFFTTSPESKEITGNYSYFSKTRGEYLGAKRLTYNGFFKQS